MGYSDTIQNAKESQKSTFKRFLYKHVTNIYASFRKLEKAVPSHFAEVDY